MKRKLAGAAMTMLLAALAAGCGDGDDGGASTGAAPAPLTKAEFVTRADAACTEANAKIAAGARRLREVGKKTGAIATPLVVAFLEQTSLPAYEAMLRKVQALKPPTADQKTIDGYVAALAIAIDKVKADTEAYAQDPAPDDPFDEPKSRARAYGLEVCGS